MPNLGVRKVLESTGACVICCVMTIAGKVWVTGDASTFCQDSNLMTDITFSEAKLHALHIMLYMHETASWMVKSAEFRMRQPKRQPTSTSLMLVGCSTLRACGRKSRGTGEGQSLVFVGVVCARERAALSRLHYLQDCRAGLSDACLLVMSRNL